jgi:gliding motility associated protien GldN
MKNYFLLFIAFVTVISTVYDANAQGRGRGRGTTTPPPTTGGATTGNPAPPTTGGGRDTSKPKTTFITPKKTIDTARANKESSGKEYGAEVKASRRNAFAYTKESLSDRKPLAYDHVREDDATYSQFVWREIDGREKINLPFIYSAKDETGDQRFFSILITALKDSYKNGGDLLAFSPEDDRFTTPLSLNEVLALSSPETNILDTQYAKNVDDENVMDTFITWKKSDIAPKPDSVFKFRIKEQWFFDKEASRMTVRIIGIAPMAPDITISGPKVKNAGPPKYNPIFWIYYPDLRPTLSRTFAYNPKNMGGRLTWEEVFEGRFFSSYITKSTLNNPKDLTLARLIQDPLYQLLEGENIKEKLFNYEQDLWSY